MRDERLGNRTSWLTPGREPCVGPRTYAGPTVGATLAALIKATLGAVKLPSKDRSPAKRPGRLNPERCHSAEVTRRWPFAYFSCHTQAQRSAVRFRRSVRSASSWSRVVRDWTVDDFAWSSPFENGARLPDLSPRRTRELPARGSDPQGIGYTSSQPEGFEPTLRQKTSGEV